MDIDASKFRNSQDRLGQNQAISRYHGHVRRKSGEGQMLGLVLQAGRRMHRNAPGIRVGMDGTGCLAMPPSGGAGRLAVDGNNPMPGVDQGIERGDREIGTPHENQA